jgi:hypothetical protein
MIESNFSVENLKRYSPKVPGKNRIARDFSDQPFFLTEMPAYSEKSQYDGVSVAGP